MMIRNPALAFVILAAGCSSSTNPPGGNPDIGTAVDMATSDGPGGADMPPAALPGKNILKAQGLTLAAITSDDNILYMDAKNALNAVPLGGGSTKSITPGGTTFSNVQVSGTVVFAGSSIDTMSRQGDLYAWSSGSSAAHLNQQGVSFYLLETFAASDDGRYVMYTDNAQATAADIYLAKVDGTRAKLVFANASFDGTQGACFSRIGFAGTKFVVSHCPANGSVATISTVNPADGTVTDIFKNARSLFAVDQKDSRLIVFDATGVAPDGGVPDAGVATPFMWSIGFDGSSPVKIDNDVFYGFTPPAGGVVLYGTNSSQLRRSTLNNPLPTTLATSNFSGFPLLNGVSIALSNDAKWVYTLTKLGSSGQISDLYVASTSKAGVPRPLVATASGCLFNDAFTTDSRFATYYSNCVSSSGALVGTFNAVDLNAQAKAIMIGTKVWNNMSTSKPATVLFNDNWKPKAPTNGRADLKVVDLSATTPAPSLLVAQAEADFLVSTDKSQYIYAYATVAAAAGIYVAPAP